MGLGRRKDQPNNNNNFFFFFFVRVYSVLEGNGGEHILFFGSLLTKQPRGGYVIEGDKFRIKKSINRGGPPDFFYREYLIFSHALILIIQIHS